MAREIDSLTSTTLKHLRDRWWDDAFATFLDDTLQPQPGSRILDVGCGSGTAELHLGLSRVAGVSLFGIDIVLERVREARAVTRKHEVRVGLAAASAARLPFASAAFDSAFCVAVLQHLADPSDAVAELSRVTRPGGRVVVVEPDNDAQYWFSSSDAGRQAHEAATRFFRAVADVEDGAADPVIGPRIPGLFLRHQIQPLAVQLFPVSVSRVGAPAPPVWESRRQRARCLVGAVDDRTVRQFGTEYLERLEQYARAAADEGPGFVEIQNTLLIATVGHRLAA